MAKKKKPKVYRVPDDVAERYEAMLATAQAEQTAILQRLSGQISEWAHNATRAAGVPDGSEATYKPAERAFFIGENK